MLSTAQHPSVSAPDQGDANLLRRWPGWVAFATVVLAALLDCLEIGVNGVPLAGVNIYVDDVAALVLLTAGLFGLVRYRRGLPGDAVPCVVLLALAVIDFARGIGPFGLKDAGNTSRDIFEYAAPAAAIMLLAPLFRLPPRRLARWIVWAGYALSAVAALRWAGRLPMPVALAETSGLREVIRALPSDYACVIGLALIAALQIQIAERPRFSGWVPVAVFTAVTVLLQHRSVWAATAAGVGWLFARTARSRSLRWLTLAGFGVGSLTVAALAVPGSAERVELLFMSNVKETEGTNSTWAWRVQGYQEATDRLFASDATDILAGPPAGLLLNVSAGFASIHIHSRYVSTLAYYGIFGLSALLLWFTMLARRVTREPQTAPGSGARMRPEAHLLEALLLAELVYMVPYSGSILQSACLGLLWVAADRLRRPIAAHWRSLAACVRTRDPRFKLKALK
jgi:hypothetical protein